MSILKESIRKPYVPPEPRHTDAECAVAYLKYGTLRKAARALGDISHHWLRMKILRSHPEVLKRRKKAV